MQEELIKKTINDFLTKGNFTWEEIDILLDENDGTYWCAISTKDSRDLIGRDGDVIRALNTLVRQIVEKGLKEGVKMSRVVVDVNNYQKDKNDKIKTIAHMMAERARFFKSNVEFEPMNSYERRLVHDYISTKFSDLKTESEGRGKERKVVVKFIKEV